MVLPRPVLEGRLANMTIHRGWNEVDVYYGLSKAPYKLTFHWRGECNFVASISKCDAVTGAFRSRYEYHICRTVDNVDSFMGATVDFDTRAIQEWNYFSTKLNKPYDTKLYVHVDFFPKEVIELEVVGLEMEPEEANTELNLGHVFSRDADRGFDIGGDWGGFVKKNGLKVGRTYCFKIMSELNGKFPFMKVMDHGKKYRVMNILED